MQTGWWAHVLVLGFGCPALVFVSWSLETRVYLDPGCPSFLGVMSHKFVGYTPKKVGHPGPRYFPSAHLQSEMPPPGCPPSHNLCDCLCRFQQSCPTGCVCFEEIAEPSASAVSRTAHLPLTTLNCSPKGPRTQIIGF